MPPAIARSPFTGTRRFDTTYRQINLQPTIRMRPRSMRRREAGVRIRGGFLATVIAIAPTLAAALLAGCGGSAVSPAAPPSGGSTPSAVAQAQRAATAVDPAIVAADNAFGLRLLAALLPASNGNNIAISPLAAALQASLIEADPKVQVTIANSLWIDQGGGMVPPSFTELDQTYYGATIGDLAGAPGNVNAWVDSETHGLIPVLPPPGQYFDAIIADVL